MVKLVTSFIKSRGFYVIDSLPTVEQSATYSKLISVSSRIGSKPFRTDMHSDLGDWLGKAMHRVFEDDFDGAYYEGGYGNTFTVNDTDLFDYAFAVIYSDSTLLGGESDTNLVLTLSKAFSF